MSSAAAKKESELPVLDDVLVQQIRDLQVEGEPDLLQHLIKLFIESAPTTIAAIRKHSEAQNPKELIEAAHYLKSSCLTLGATSMGYLCAHLEEMGKARRYDQVRSQYELLEEEYERTKEALGRLKK